MVLEALNPLIESHINNTRKRHILAEARQTNTQLVNICPLVNIIISKISINREKYIVAKPLRHYASRLR